MVKYSVKAV